MPLSSTGKDKETFGRGVTERTRVHKRRSALNTLGGTRQGVRTGPPFWIIGRMCVAEFQYLASRSARWRNCEVSNNIIVMVDSKVGRVLE